MKRIFTFIAALGLLYGCSSTAVKEVSIVPKPVKLEQKAGVFTLKNGSVISFDASNARLAEIADLTAMMVKNYSGLELVKGEKGEGISFVIVNDTKANPESYKLKVNGDGIVIEAPTEAGIFYGVQSLSQMIEPEMAESVDVACVEIEDSPRLEWRGLHLDVGRHFFTKDEVKKFIDVMSMYKLNKFHWHLTEDQGWRIEIKKYPRLTEFGAYRKSVGFPDNQKKGLNKDDGKPYGGFYTQEDIKEVVKYAMEREIEVIPEIEIPGHSMAAVASYPELYCFPNEKLELRLVGGVSDGVYCAGKEETFTFLENVLTEVIELFPSKYIHIGGDEAPKNNWSKCPACQKRIKAEGLKDEFELQSYVIHRIEKFLNAHGRQIIGWDEIMEGGLSKTATVMAWRGTTPGIEAAEMGNKVIMTPGNPCYLSQPQSVNEVTQVAPTASVNTMYNLYAYNPVPKELPAEYVKNIMGIQACQWSESSPNFFVMMYKNYPRAIALAEIAWTPQELRNWDDFYVRHENNLKYLDKAGVAHGARSYDVNIALVPDEKTDKVMLNFTQEVPGPIYYTMDGSEPTDASKVFDNNVVIDRSCTVKAVKYRPDGSKGRVASEDIYFHKGLGKKVTYNIPYSDKHNGGGDYAMTNGMLNKWQGFEKRDVDMVLDLKKETEFSTIRCNWFYDLKDWVQRPTEVKYEISNDGENFEEVFTDSFTQPEGLYNKGTETLEKKFDSPVKARYVRVKAKNVMVNQKWHTSVGAAVWVFVDEIIVE